MMLSGNGWQADPNPDAIDITDFVVDGVDFGGVRGGDAYRLLHRVVSQVSRRVERANANLGCYGYNFRPNVNSPGEWSNHASGTAVDFNASRHPNGVPTTETWTAAQIDEIHAILDEVGGAVRWGGDYEGTPDAMHFEIDVPPEDVDPDMIAGFPETEPQQGVMGQPVGGVISEAPLLTEMSVSFPTPAIYAENGAEWRFIPTQSGTISIDAMLSHWMDDAFSDQDPLGPAVGIWLYRVEGDELVYVAYSNYYSSEDPNFPDPRRQGRIYYHPVVAGQTYVIRTTATTGATSYPWIRMVVRIGDYAVIPDWTQPDDITHVYGKTGSNHPPEEYTVLLNNGQTAGVYFAEYYQGNVQDRRPGFRGASEAKRAFGGPNPGEDAFARSCFWPKARRFYWSGRYFWSKYGGASWNGTDPYDGSVEGYGTCPIADVADYPSTNGFGDEAVGSYFMQEKGFPGFGFNDWAVFTAGTNFRPQKIVTHATKSGYFDMPINSTNIPYLPDLELGETYQWESTSCELILVRYAPDEIIAYNNNPVIDRPVKWYVAPEGSAPEGTWGPRYDGSFNQTTYSWVGRPDGAPEDWFAQQDHVADYNGGLAGWQVLPLKWWHEDYWDTIPDGVHFACAPPELFSDTPPDILAPFDDLPDGGKALYKLRSGVHIAIEATVRPSRFRVLTPARIPDITWAGYGDIAVGPDDDGRVFY